MRSGVLFLAGAAIHFAFAALVVLSLIWLPEYRGRPLDATAVGVVVFIAAIYAFLGFALLKARTGSSRWVKLFAVGGGIFLGNVVAIGGWRGGLLYAIPLATGLLALWRHRKLDALGLGREAPEQDVAPR